VHEGSILLEVDDQSFVLVAGDAVAFRGEVAHSYANHGSEPARLSLAVFEPGVGTGSRHG
jgi:quercetin dioxygenase-like cupin family protein